MKYFSIVAIAAALVLPFAYAAPNAQTGQQTSGFWTESTFVAVQGGTGFQLHGIAGDFDIIFYSASGSFLAFYLACGADSGTVPGNAAVAEIMKWDDLGELAPCAAPSVGLPSTFVYVDGL